MYAQQKLPSEQKEEKILCKIEIHGKLLSAYRGSVLYGGLESCGLMGWFVTTSLISHIVVETCGKANMSSGISARYLRLPPMSIGATVVRFPPGMIFFVPRTPRVGIKKSNWIESSEI